MVYPILRTIFFPFMRLFIRKIAGLDNVPKKGPYIIACKHVSYLDGFFLASILIPRVKQRVHFVASIMKWGWIWEVYVAQKWAGCIPFDKNDRSSCLSIALNYLKKGEIVGIYPEGYLHEYGVNNYSAKTGTARLALQSKAPIIPVGLVYDITVRNDLPVLYQYSKAIKNTLFNPRSLEIHFGKPFTLEQYYDKDINKNMLKEATNGIMNHIQELTSINNINK